MNFFLKIFEYFLGYVDLIGYFLEDGVVDDSYFMYRWIKERSGVF